MENSNHIYLDIYINDRFYCQMPYFVRGFVDEDEAKEYIESQRPSLKSKDYKVRFSNQKI